MLFCDSYVYENNLQEFHLPFLDKIKVIFRVNYEIELPYRTSTSRILRLKIELREESFKEVAI